MAYNHGKEERKWRIWKEAEEKMMREYGVNESVIEKIRTYDRSEFNSDRQLDEIENESLYRALLTVDKRTVQIVLLKMQGYSTKEIASLVGLTTGAVHARLDHLRKKLKQFYLKNTSKKVRAVF